MSDGADSLTHTVTDGGLAAKHPPRHVHAVFVGPSIASEFNVIEEDFAPEACVRFDDVRFEFDSSFVSPEAATELKLLGKLVKENPLRPASIFGHADPVGDDVYNKTLSGRRAQAVYGLVTRKTDLWEDLFKNPQGGDNWGTKSIQVMLKALGHYDGPVNGVLDAKTRDAVKSFQGSPEGAGLTVDGDPGGKTRPKLYAAYMDKICVDDAGQPFKIDPVKGFLAQGADAGGKGDFQGCSEFNPDIVFSQAESERFKNPSNKAERDNENKPNRRVVIYLFRQGSKISPGSWPCPRVKEGVAGCKKRFFSDGEKRRSNQAERRTFEKTKDTFACRFYDRVATLSPCESPPKPPPKPVLKFVKIETEKRVLPPLLPVFEEDDDFSPRLKERAKVHVSLTNLPPGFAGTLRVDFGRLTNRADNIPTPDINESFTLVSRVEVAVAATGADPQVVEVLWDGLATVAVPQEFSNRQTVNTNSGANVNVPLNAIATGDPIPHGLYFIDQITLLQGAAEVAKERPVDVGLSVPVLVNISFNANFAGDLSAFGLTPFRADIETALLRFGGRDYMIRDPALANRINARYINDATITNAQSMLATVGGADPAGGGLFGSTPDGPAPLSDNLYVFHEGLSATIDIFPSTFMTFNTAAGAIGPLDQATFQAIFSPLGVGAAATVAAPGVASPRTVAADGSVTGACTALDSANVTVTLDDDGIATVVSTNPAIVPDARVIAIQRALRAFVQMVGNTLNHEVAHSLGVVSRIRANNQITINGTTVTSPLNGDGGAHNRVTNNTNIVDGGGTRSFVRRIEDTGVRQVFNATNARYMRDCIPFDRRDD